MWFGGDETRVYRTWLPAGSSMDRFCGMIDTSQAHRTVLVDRVSMLAVNISVVQLFNLKRPRSDEDLRMA